jgi:integrase
VLTGVEITTIFTTTQMKVTIEAQCGKLRLRFNDGAKRHCISLGVDDSSIGRSLALKKKYEIELDFQTGHYDRTLLKYRSRTLGKNPTEVSTVELFNRFTAHELKSRGLAQSSIKARYKPISRMLEKYLNKPAHEIRKNHAENFASICAETLTGQVTKERLRLLLNCWNWAQGKYELASDNPWLGINQRFKPSPRQQVKPFTLAELQAILSAFKIDPHYCHYLGFVSFLTNTGCRFGEAAGLKWKHLGAGYATAWIGESVSRGTRRTTKTGKARTILLSKAMQTALTERYQQVQCNPDDLVFPSPTGIAINDKSFRARAWKSILLGCEVEYRKPYALRHSAISHALAAGANPIALAEQTGHDKRVLLDTYAHAIAKEFLFVEV